MDPCDSISEITFYFITYSHAYIKKKLQLFHINLHSGSLSLWATERIIEILNIRRNT